MTTIEGRVALVTGGSRGLGQAFAAELLARGAAKVYVTARDAQSVPITDPRLVPLPLEVSDPASIAALPTLAPDVTVLFNNAGISTGASVLTGDVDDIRNEFEINVLGPILVTRAMAPVITANGGGAILNVHSALSWRTFGDSYSATKAAAWSATNAIRLGLDGQGVQVVGLHVGYIDTDMTASVTAPKLDAAVVANAALDAIESGQYEVLVDEISRQVKAQLSDEITVQYPQLAGAVQAA